MSGSSDYFASNKDYGDSAFNCPLKSGDSMLNSHRVDLPALGRASPGRSGGLAARYFITTSAPAQTTACAR